MRKRTIQQRLFLSCLFALLIPLTALLFIIKRNYASIATNKIDEILQKTVIQKDADVQNIMNRMVMVANTIVSERDIWETLGDGIDSQLESGRIIQHINTILSNSYDMPLDVAIFSENELFKTWQGRMEAEKVFSLIGKEIEKYEQEGKFIIWFENESRLLSGYLNYDIRSYNLLRAMSVKGKKYYILVSIEEDQIARQLFGDWQELEDIYLVEDAEGDYAICIYSQKQHPVTRKEMPEYLAELPDTNYFRVHSSYQAYGDSYRSTFITISKNVNYELRQLNGIIYIITLAIILIFCVVLYHIRNVISLPLNNLLGEMKRARETQEYSIVKQDNNVHEIELLNKEYNKLVISINEYIARLKGEEKEKRDIFLKMLQMQINPHFLFNTLNSIKWVCYLNQDEQAGELIANLGKMYELSMNREGMHLTLGEEKDFIASYVALMENRYGMEAQFSFEIEEGLEGAIILKFLLQPLVENIFIHGFVEDMEDPCIAVTAKAEEGNLLIFIRDNGAGMNPEDLERLSHELGRKSKITSRIGLINVNHRITLHYGEKYGIRMENAGIGERGMTVILTLPIVYGE